MHPRARRFARAVVLLAVISFLTCPSAITDDDAEASTPKTVAVKAGPFEVTLALSGTFAPNGPEEVAYEPEAYGGPLKVLEAAGPGLVKKGQLLVRFDTEEIDRHLAERGRELAIAEGKFKRQEGEAQRAGEAMAIATAQVEARVRRTNAALRHFREVTKPLRIAQGEYNLEGTENRIQDQVEELEQLERMYREDDLTEETEEIVLRRARRNLERSRRSLAFARSRHKDLLEITLVREEEDLVLETRKKANELAAHHEAAGISLKERALSLEKARVALEKQRKGLRDLVADRDAMKVVAPRDGYAVPGSFSGGKWLKVSETRKQLTPGGKVGARQVLFTIVQPGDVHVVSTVGEGDLLKLEVGMAAEVRPAIASDTSLAAAVAEVMVVGTGGKFAVRLDLEESHDRLMAGYACKIKVVLKRKAHALSLPVGAVQKDRDMHVVFVWVDGKALPMEVGIGMKSGGRIEITEGLEAGQRVLAQPPEDE